MMRFRVFLGECVLVLALKVMGRDHADAVTWGEWLSAGAVTIRQVRKREGRR